MRIVADLHTHTMVSHHAYSTLRENCQEASRQGLSMLATTDHGYGAPDSANDWHFASMWIVPRIVEGVYHLRGAEANIMAMDGTLDLKERDQRFVDVLIASLHSYCIRPQDANAHTEAYLGALSNPYVDILGHSATTRFPFDEEVIVRRLAETGKMLEINAHAMLMEPASIEINRRLLGLCKRFGARVALGSDAHVCYEVGNFDFVRQLLAEEEFPPELVLNMDLRAMVQYVNDKPQIKTKLPLSLLEEKL